MIRITIVLCIGGLAGAAATFWFLTEQAEKPVETSSRARMRATGAREGQLGAAEPTRTEAGPTTQQPDAADGDNGRSVMTPALREFASREIRQGWSAVRRDLIPEDDLGEGMKEYERLVLEQPGRIGRALAMRRTRSEQMAEDARSGGGRQVLEQLDQGGVGPLPELVRQPAFDDLFRRMTADSPIKGESNWLRPDDALHDGYTLLFPPGVFRLEHLMHDADPFPRDVTIAGAGMDLTLIAVGDLSTRGPLRNFTIRDCTIHTRDHPLLDLRNDIATVTLSRARFVGFDSGTGGSSLFATRPLALRATGCRFEGGYGSGRDGTIFDVRSDGLLARFDDCCISGLALHIAWMHPGATVLFRACTLKDILDDPQRDARDRPGVAFESCRIEQLPHPGTLQARDLNDLFPNYSDEWNRGAR
ncbi:MAG: hypothetical protein U1E76_03460 [Planctomycetota bacterium]